MTAETTASWLDAVTAGVSGYAASALQLGEGAAATLAGALARIQALPDEAAVAVGELTTALGALLPQDGFPPPAPAPDGAGSPVAAGPRGGFGRTPRVVPRRTRIAAAAFGRFIREQHPHKPAENASALTGIPVDSIEKMLARETLPNGPNFLLCVIAYGPALIAAVLPEADDRWLVGAQILADQARLEAELAATQAARAANAARWSFCGIEFGVLA